MKKIIFILILILSLAGCRSLEYSTRYYTVLTASPLPPKPEGTIIPVIQGEFTRRAYKVIGEMEFESGSSDKHIMNAIQYNGRRNGADAIILKEWTVEKETYTSWHPVGWFGFSYNNYRSCDNGLYWAGNYQVPLYESYTNTKNKIKAEMILFLDHDTFGYLGLVFEDIRNTNYLEVKEVLTSSPADKNGFQTGDKILRINDYKLNMGIEDFYQNAPEFTVGETFEIEFLRGDQKNITTLTAAKMTQ